MRLSRATRRLLLPLAFTVGTAPISHAGGTQDLRSYFAPEKQAEATSGPLTARAVYERIFKSGPNARPDLLAADLARLDLSELDFKSAELSRSNLYGADLTNASLAGASLVGASLDRATITAVDFSNADLTDAHIIRPTVFTTLEVSTREAPKFTGAKLVRTRSDGWLDRADFTGADLTGAILGRTAVREASVNAPPSLVSANFTRAILRDAKLAKTSLMYARFIDADLRGADLSGSNLLQADFSGADLTGANLTGANLDEANLGTAKGLDQVIGLDTALNLETARRTPPAP